MYDPADIVRSRKQAQEEKDARELAELQQENAEKWTQIQRLIPIALQSQIKRNGPDLSDDLIIWNGREEAVWQLHREGDRSSEITICLIRTKQLIIRIGETQLFQLYDHDFANWYVPSPGKSDEYNRSRFHSHIIKALERLAGQEAFKKARPSFWRALFS